ncbi:hypothetical protein HV346_09790 [Enterobacter sp. RHBSTW-00994]|uniref:hypothetical protein n=1 Tax=Enterobacteriaceae TaxID=543 RepID=UPI0015E8F192|nr:MULTISPECIES: hypothetical protein [Enterobacteriaceae]MBM3070885.1 hypothetical protein [Lelliottia sp. RWM.1]QLR42944.1 hypothetical protein HV346_09790 [Enterobacter sp. RHBSTW-00994]
MGQLRMLRRFSTQNKEAESMTSITKNEKLAKQQKIFSGKATIEEGSEGEVSPPV